MDTEQERLAAVEKTLQRAKNTIIYLERRNRRSRRLTLAALVLAIVAAGLSVVAFAGADSREMEERVAGLNERFGDFVKRIDRQERQIAQVQAGADTSASVVRASAFLLVDDEGQVRGHFKMLDGGPYLILQDDHGSRAVSLSVQGGVPRLILHGDDDEILGIPTPRISLAVERDGLAIFGVGDEKGQLRASIGVDKDGPVLALLDEDGKLRVGLNAFKDGPALRLADEKGKLRVTLTAGKDEPSLYLYDENEQHRVALGANKDGPVLALADEKGNFRVALAAAKDGPVLDLLDEKGNFRVRLAAVKDGPALWLADQGGQPRVRLDVDEAPGPRLRFWNDTGHVSAALIESALLMRDEQGRTRVGLGVSGPGPYLSMTDYDGRPRAGMEVTDFGPALELWNEQGDPVWSAP